MTMPPRKKQKVIPQPERKYKDEFLDYGFTEFVDKGVSKPQCVICHKVLSSENMKPGKLRAHLDNVHPEHKDQDREFFLKKESIVRNQRLDATGHFAVTNRNAVHASYDVAYLLAKAKKPHTLAEELIMPAAKIMTERMCGDKESKKLSKVSVSDDTMRRRIDDMAGDVEEQVICEIRSSPFNFAIQLDESTDVANCAQLLCFVRYVVLKDKTFKDEYLFCICLQTTTTGYDIFDCVSNYFDAHQLDWNKLEAICTDGAPAMIGVRSGFVARVREKNPSITVVHCAIHRQVIASKTLPDELKIVMDTVIKSINLIKTRATNTRLFRAMCEEVGSEHVGLLLHTEVRWLSRGRVVQRVYELRNEISDFLATKDHCDAEKFKDDVFLAKLAYLCDIFGALNNLNISLQGQGSCLLDVQSKLDGFCAQLDLWIRRIDNGNVAMLTTLDSIVQSTGVACPTDLVYEHLQELRGKLERYCPKAHRNTDVWVKQPFASRETCIEDSDDAKDEFVQLRADEVSKEEFSAQDLPTFWLSTSNDYPKLFRRALKVLLPFPTTYLCESGFSALFYMKDKYRTRLQAGADLRLALSKTSPRIDRLIAKKQLHSSH